MAIDPHDDEAAARAMLAAAEADTSTGAERLRTAGRLFTRVLIVTLIVAPVFLSIALWRFTQALQTGNWPAFWVAIVGSAALLMLPIYLYFYDPTADRNSGLAYVYLRGSVNSGDENLAPIVSISLAPVPRLARLQYVHVIGGEYKARAAFVQAFQGCYLALLLLVVTWFGGWVSST